MSKSAFDMFLKKHGVEPQPRNDQAPESDLVMARLMRLEREEGIEEGQGEVPAIPEVDEESEEATDEDL